ncbi:MAG TPA: alpha/beta hydrolase [Pseudolabrys sp.]|nr:alpha/beta hydrolase [Pseudolabrys sp.]
MNPKTSALVVSLLSMTMLCAGCAGRPEKGVLTPVAEKANVEGTSRVRVLAATTRQRSSTDPGDMFNGERAEEVSYASITVSIPPDGSRKVGEVQWPESLPGDPRRDFVTVSADYLSKQDFRGAVGAAVKANKRKRVLVFVHGFNNRFDDAVYRFSQIVHDSGSPAVPILFTWPSRGELKLRAYTYDRESANYSRDALEALLDDIASNPNVAEINVVAHSMGNWVTLEALRSRSIRAKRGPDKIKNVFLVAPDVDTDVFRTQIQRIGTPRPRILLFVSQDDKALALSQTIWGGVPRLGEIDPAKEPYRSQLEREHIEVFDLTSLKTAGDDAHDRAFDDVTRVMTMVKQRYGEDQ